MIGRRSGRTAGRAGVASSEPLQEWRAACGPAPDPAPLQRAALAGSRSSSRRLVSQAASLPPLDVRLLANNFATGPEASRRRVRPTHGRVSTSGRGTAARGTGKRVRRRRPPRASVSPSARLLLVPPTTSSPEGGGRGSRPHQEAHGDPRPGLGWDFLGGCAPPWESPDPALCEHREAGGRSPGRPAGGRSRPSLRPAAPVPRCPVMALPPRPSAGLGGTQGGRRCPRGRRWGGGGDGVQPALGTGPAGGGAPGSG